MPVGDTDYIDFTESIPYLAFSKCKTCILQNVNGNTKRKYKDDRVFEIRKKIGGRVL